MPVGLAAALQPGVASGDFEFYADATTLTPAAGGRALVRVLVQLPVRAFLDLTKANRADLAMRVRAFGARTALDRIAAGNSVQGGDSLRALYGHADGEVERMLQEFDGMKPVAEAASRTRIEVAKREELRATDFRLLDLSLELPPGDHVVEVVAENLSRKKRGLLDRLRNRPMSSVVRLLLRVPDLEREPALADLVFETGHGERSPYPARLYGLLNDSLHVRSRLFAHGAFELYWTATDRSGDVAWRDSTRVEAAGGGSEISCEASVNSLPAGQYVLQLVAVGSHGTVSTSRSFDVAWALVTWKTSRRDADVEAELALSEDQFQEYRALPVGEKERYLEQFWRALDPTPDTAENEVLQEFNRRVAYADLSFSEAMRGALTDRGRIYVHFGRPDEVQAEALPSHLAGRGGEDVLEKVDDVYHPTEQREDGVLERTGQTHGTSPWERSIQHEERNRVIGPAREVTSYELWIYAGSGKPLFPEVRAVTMDTGLRVLFIDLTGFGQYRLRKSSVRLPIHGLTPEF